MLFTQAVSDHEFRTLAAINVQRYSAAGVPVAAVISRRLHLTAHFFGERAGLVIYPAVKSLGNANVKLSQPDGLDIFQTSHLRLHSHALDLSTIRALSEKRIFPYACLSQP